MVRWKAIVLSERFWASHLPKLDAAVGLPVFIARLRIESAASADTAFRSADRALDSLYRDYPALRRPDPDAFKRLSDALLVRQLGIGK